jgi:DHA2 family multidrug resistance protein-like MFS transporter
VFLIAVPVGLAVLVLGPRWLPEHVDPAAAQRVDGLGAGLLVAALACVFVVIKAAIPGSGAPGALVVAAGVGALVAGTGFVRRQLTADAPLLDLRVLATPVVATTVGSLTLAAVVLAGTGFWATQYLQSDAGMTPLAAAIAFAPMALSIAVGTQVAGVLNRWIPAEVLIPGGLLVSAAGELLFTLVTPDQPLLPLIAAYTVTGFGCAPLFTFGTQRLMSAPPPEAAGRAAALAETGNHLGSAIGIALLGTVGRLAAPAMATGSGSLVGALHLVGPVGAGVLVLCAGLTVGATLAPSRRER